MSGPEYVPPALRGYFDSSPDYVASEVPGYFYYCPTPESVDSHLAALIVRVNDESADTGERRDGFQRDVNRLASCRPLIAMLPADGMPVDGWSDEEAA